MLVSILLSGSPLEVVRWFSQVDCGCGFWRAIPQRKDGLHHTLVKEPGVPEVLLTVTTSEAASAWWLPCESVFLLLLFFWNEVGLLHSSLKSRGLYWVQLLRLLHCLEFSYMKVQYFAHFILISVWIQRYLSYTVNYNPYNSIYFALFFSSSGFHLELFPWTPLMPVCAHAHMHTHSCTYTLAHTHTPWWVAYLSQALPYFLILPCPSGFSCICCAPMPESVILPGIPGLLETCMLLANGVSFISCKQRLLFNSRLTRPK